MSFYASNSRIRVLDGAETVFDTDENMPHIIGTAYVSDVDVSFDAMSSSSVYWFFDPCAYLAYVPPYYHCDLTSYSYYVDNPPYCQANPSFCVTYPGYCYSSPPYCIEFPGYCFGFGDYISCSPGYSSCSPGSSYCSPDTTSCVPNPPYCIYNAPSIQYAYQYYCTSDYNPPVCAEMTYYQQQYNSREVSADSVLCNLPTDEDGNAMDVDFVVIQASGSRTVAGTDKLIGVAFASTVPANTFSFQGSILLESSGRENNTFWMRRILSVFVNSATKKLVLRKQETVAARLLKDQPSGGEGSTFRMNFKVFFGRFRS